MGERIHVLAQQLLGKNSIESCSLQEIRDLVHRYPYFAPARFLLLEKLKQDHDPEYNSQLQKTVLYYHNPIAFEYFFSSDRFYTEENIDPGEMSIVHENGTGLVSEDQLKPVENLGEVHKDYQEIKETLAEDNNLIPVENTGDMDENMVTGNNAKTGNGMEQVETSLPPVELNTTQPADLVFEPYHTVDYFASQGIKLSQEEAPKDKFGRQLKSFTEWLKTMKKLPVNEQPNQDTTSEQKVLHMAEDSVHEADVVTEAMAEVWLKQGNHQKALEIYQQLSLLNPSKKAYFAARIENLKNT